jgi:hypothetical protein
MGGGDAMSGAMDMAATGVGLGIMTMGAMVPIKMMSQMMDEQGTKKKKKKKGVKIKMPKINI